MTWTCGWVGRCWWGWWWWWWWWCLGSSRRSKRPHQTVRYCLSPTVAPSAGQTSLEKISMCWTNRNHPSTNEPENLDEHDLCRRESLIIIPHDSHEHANSVQGKIVMYLKLNESAWWISTSCVHIEEHYSKFKLIYMRVLHQYQRLDEQGRSPQICTVYQGVTF